MMYPPTRIDIGKYLFRRRIYALLQFLFFDAVLYALTALSIVLIVTYLSLSIVYYNQDIFSAILTWIIGGRIDAAALMGDMTQPFKFAVVWIGPAVLGPALIWLSAQSRSGFHGYDFTIFGLFILLAVLVFLFDSLFGSPAQEFGAQIRGNPSERLDIPSAPYNLLIMTSYIYATLYAFIAALSIIPRLIFRFISSDEQIHIVEGRPEPPHTTIGRYAITGVRPTLYALFFSFTFVAMAVFIYPVCLVVFAATVRVGAFISWAAQNSTLLNSASPLDFAFMILFAAILIYRSLTSKLTVWKCILPSIGFLYLVFIVSTGRSIFFYDNATQIWQLDPVFTVLFTVQFILVLRNLIFDLFFFNLAQLQKRTRRDASRILDRTLSKPVLFLRSFQDDETVIPVGGTFGQFLMGPASPNIRLEEVIADEMSREGPVIALSNPNLRQQPLGAARQSFPKEDSSQWRDYVTHMIGQSRWIVVSLGETEGLLWEIEQIVHLDALDRLILVLPSTYPHEVTLSETSALLAHRLIVPSPGVEKDRFFFAKIAGHNRTDSSFSFFTTPSRGIMAYRIALRAAMTAAER